MNLNFFDFLVKFLSTAICTNSEYFSLKLSLCILLYICWQQSAAINVEQEVGKCQEIKIVVHQGCVLLGDLFSIYCENIMQNIDKLPGMPLEGIQLKQLEICR